jgi:hypothetical protein
VVRSTALEREAEPTLEELRATMTEVWGTDLGVCDPTWISSFSDATRQAERYRAGRILLAGEAAHVHSPAGGQGLGLGLQDAVNLGWKLARVVRDGMPDSLLDTYHAERHPVAARVLRTTMAMTALQRSDDRLEALRDTLAGLLELDAARRRLAGLLSGLDVRYDLGGGHPLLGRRMPDRDLTTADGSCRVFDLLHDARPLLLDLGGLDGFDAAAWSGVRLRVVRARSGGAWELPVLGEVPAPAAVLVRPDGHVAWVGEEAGADGLAAALERWVGRADGSI